MGKSLFGNYTFGKVSFSEIIHLGKSLFGNYTFGKVFISEIDLGSCLFGNFTFGKIIHLEETAAWEVINLGKCFLGN